MEPIVRTKSHGKNKKTGQSEDRRSFKVTEEAFSAVPHLKNFAILAKASFRKKAAFGCAFPPCAPVERNEFILQLLLDTANENHTHNSTENYPRLVIQVAKFNEDLFDKLCTFVSAGHSLSLYILLNILLSGYVRQRPIDKLSNH